MEALTSSGSWRHPRSSSSSSHLCISWRTQRNKHKKKKKKKAKYEHRGQVVVFTYLYFSHARIRAARICLINTFPACLSRGYSNFVRADRGIEGRGGGNNVEISLRCPNIEKSFPFLPYLRAFFSRLHGIRNTSYKGGTNRPYRTRFLFTSATERD